jgi:hypothetical protein
MDRSKVLQEMIDAGEAARPAASGMPDSVPDLAPGVDSLADLVIAERDDERRS